MQEKNDSRGQDGQEKVSAESSVQGGSSLGSSGPVSSSAEVVGFVERLSQEDRMLVLLQRQLYEGNWDAMLADLENGLDGGADRVK